VKVIEIRVSEATLSSLFAAARALLGTWPCSLTGEEKEAAEHGAGTPAKAAVRASSDPINTLEMWEDTIFTIELRPVPL
jgi:hypothetical protein